MIRLLNSSSTYGEITTKGFRELAKRIELYSGDCFLDMGSGVGRVVVQAALEFGCRSSLGVELSMTRHERAQQALLDVISARGALHAAWRSSEASVHIMRSAWRASSRVRIAGESKAKHNQSDTVRLETANTS